MNDPHTLDIPAAPPFPNSRLPVLLYRGAVPADPGGIEDAFAACGWSNAWRNSIYRFHHFHSIAHEVLGIAAGQVTVRLGGPTGPQVELAAGDVVVIPAGVAHCNLHEDGPLLVVGAYPGGAQFDTLRGDPEAFRAAASRAAAVAVPERDPVPGHNVLRRLWTVAGA